MLLLLLNTQFYIGVAVKSVGRYLVCTLALNNKISTNIVKIMLYIKKRMYIEYRVYNMLLFINETNSCFFPFCYEVVQDGKILK